MGPVREALEVTLKSDARLSLPRHAALVSLCRVFADQIDDAGSEVSSRLTAAYLSALKDVDKALGTKTTGAAPGAAPAPAATAEANSAGNGSALGQLRAVKGGKAS